MRRLACCFDGERLDVERPHQGSLDEARIGDAVQRHRLFHPHKHAPAVERSADGAVGWAVVRAAMLPQAVLPWGYGRYVDRQVLPGLVFHLHE